MQVNKEMLVGALELVECGISDKGIVEQSDCFVFQDGHVNTYNNQIIARMPLDLEVEGAVKSGKLLEILNKVEDEELAVTVEENKEGGTELRFKGTGRKIGMYLEPDIALPLDMVELPDADDEWMPLSESFNECMALLCDCCSTDQNKFAYTCVHFTKDYMESMDGVQILRYEAEEYEFEREFLLRADDIKEILSCSVTKYILTDTWIFFTNEEGLIVGCKTAADNYLDLDNHLNVQGDPVTLPKSIGNVCEKANVFTQERKDNPRVTVKLKQGKLKVVGLGRSGWYEEIVNVDWAGSNIQFYISPKVLTKVAEKQHDTFLTDKRLKLVGPSFQYVTVLGEADD